MTTSTTTKTFTKSDWHRMFLISGPTEIRGSIKQAPDGTRWEWIASGKRVTAKLVKL